MAADRDEVLAWLDETGEGPAAASRHFGIPSATIRSWRHRQKGVAQRRTPERTRRTTTRPKKPRGKKPVSKGARKPARKAARPVDPDLVDMETKEALRTAIAKRVAYLADDRSIGAKGQSAAAITLGILLDKFGQVVASLDGDGEGRAAATTDRVLEALGLDVDGPDAASGARGDRGSR